MEGEIICGAENTKYGTGYGITIDLDSSKDFETRDNDQRRKKNEHHRY